MPATVTLQSFTDLIVPLTEIWLKSSACSTSPVDGLVSRIEAGSFWWGMFSLNCETVLLQPLRWCCVDCVIHHERDVREE